MFTARTTRNTQIQSVGKIQSFEAGGPYRTSGLKRFKDFSSDMKSAYGYVLSYTEVR
jgi:hypothetical protein